MITGTITSAKQRARLSLVAEKAAAFGPLTWYDVPGDVMALRTGAHRLRGAEVVASTPERADGRIYDIWARNGSNLLQAGLTADEVIAWLAKAVLR
jgi:hypothetical protein